MVTKAIMLPVTRRLRCAHASIGILLLSAGWQVPAGAQTPDAAPDAGTPPAAPTPQPVAPTAPPAYEQPSGPAASDPGATEPSAAAPGPEAPAPASAPLPQNAESAAPSGDAATPDGASTAPAADSGETEAPVTPAADLAQAEDPDRTLNTVVVTARYRKEDAQKVPIAITTLTEDQLRALGGTRSLNQLVGQLPSLNIQGYSGRNQTITIRGLGTNAGSTNDGLEQGVGIYIDGVYRPRTGTVIADLADIESIQLLRGPQGTLFGKNTVAGAVDIRTVEPSFTRSAIAEATYGNYNYVRGYFALNTPLTDTLAFKLSYVRTSRDGLIYNTVYDEHWDDLNSDTVRADALWKPSDKFKTRLIADYSIQRNTAGFQLVGRALPTTLKDGRTQPGFYEKSAAVGYTPLKLDPFARKTDINSPEGDRMPSWGVQNRADYRFDNNVTFTSITAYRQWKWLPKFDGDQFGADVASVGIVETHQQQFSQELRLSSPGDQVLDYTAGLYYFWQEADDHQYSSYASQASGWLRPGSPREVLDGLTAYSHVIPATQSYAAYGQATYNVSDNFHLTGGLRATFEHKTGRYDAFPQGAIAPIDSLPEDAQEAARATRAAYGPTGSYKKSRDVANLSWTAIVAYDLTPDIHVFGTYSRGFKSPGINLVAPTLGVDVFVKPERVDNFEIGAKASFFDGRVELNPNVFYVIDKNYQANWVGQNADGRRISYITNVGTLISRGVELDARLYPVRGLTGSASLTYNDARYDSYKNAPAQYLVSYLGSQDLSGRRAAGSSKWAAGATIESAVPFAGTPESPIDFFVGANWSYRSNFYAAVNLDPFSKVPGYHLIGLNLGVRNQRNWELSFWVRNLLDTNFYSTISVNQTYGITQVSVGEPRLFGFTLRGKI